MGAGHCTALLRSGRFEECPWDCCRWSHCQLIEVNAHSLFSKWFSESGKQVLALASSTELWISVVSRAGCMQCTLHGISAYHCHQALLCKPCIRATQYRQNMFMGRWQAYLCPPSSACR